MKVVRIKARRAFQPTKLPGADYVLNPYVGCGHGCIYCYAKFMGRFYLSQLGRAKWGEWVVVKENFPELVERESGKIAKSGASVYMASVSDAYQPLEAKERITMRTLEAMDKSIKLSILTKSFLVTRDIHLFKQFKDIEIGLTINSFSEKMRRQIEPTASPMKARIRALKMLHESGLRTYAFVSPIIPGTDVEKVVDKAMEYADKFWFEFLNPGPGRPLVEILKEKGLWQDYGKWAREEAYRIGEMAKSRGIEVEGIVMHGNGMEIV